MNIETVIKKHTDALLRLPNVIGVGMGKKQGRAVIKVLVTRKCSPAELSPHEMIPPQIEGYETDVDPIGNLAIQ